MHNDVMGKATRKIMLGSFICFWDLPLADKGRRKCFIVTGLLSCPSGVLGTVFKQFAIGIATLLGEITITSDRQMTQTL